MGLPAHRNTAPHHICDVHAPARFKLHQVLQPVTVRVRAPAMLHDAPQLLAVQVAQAQKAQVHLLPGP